MHNVPWTVQLPGLCRCLYYADSCTLQYALSCYLPSLRLAQLRMDANDECVSSVTFRYGRDASGSSLPVLYLLALLLSVFPWLVVYF